MFQGAREVQEAVGFLQTFMEKKVPANQVALFGESMRMHLCRKYEHHWHEGSPQRGSGFRCIRIHYISMDPVIAEAARQGGISNIAQYFPRELCLWVDPKSVSYRIGDFGSITTLYNPAEPETVAGFSSKRLVEVA